MFENLSTQRFFFGYAWVIEAFVGEVWIADALKDGERWVVRAPTPDQAFAELRGECEEALNNARLRG